MRGSKVAEMATLKSSSTTRYTQVATNIPSSSLTKATSTSTTFTNKGQTKAYLASTVVQSKWPEAHRGSDKTALAFISRSFRLRFTLPAMKCWKPTANETSSASAIPRSTYDRRWRWSNPCSRCMRWVENLRFRYLKRWLLVIVRGL